MGYSWWTSNVVILSGEQWRDSAIHTHVSIPLQTPLPPRPPHNMEQRSLGLTVSPCRWSILNTVWVHVHPKFPLGTLKLIPFAWGQGSSQYIQPTFRAWPPVGVRGMMWGWWARWIQMKVSRSDESCCQSCCIWRVQRVKLGAGRDR